VRVCALQLDHAGGDIAHRFAIMLGDNDRQTGIRCSLEQRDASRTLIVVETRKRLVAQQDLRLCEHGSSEVQRAALRC
jgi:hypothetical protein